MPAAIVLERIATWERAGVIDHATAERLRALEDAAASPPPPDIEAANVDAPASRLPAWLTPGFSASEIFAYLGAVFVLLAWHVMVNTTFPGQGTLIGLATIGAGAALAAMGWYLGRGSDRMRRAAGLALLAAVPHVAIGVTALLHALRSGPVGVDAGSGLVGTVLALLAVVAFREVRRGMSTQLGVALATVGFAATFLTWVEPVLFPGAADAFGPGRMAPEQALLRVLFTMGWWWLVAGGMAALLLPPLHRGAEGTDQTSLGRLAVGLTAVIGTFIAVQQRYPYHELGGGDLVVSAWLGAVLIVGVAAVLVGLGVLHHATAYVWPAAFGIWLGLTYLNTQYIAEGAGLGSALLVEGVILLGVAFAARRVGDRIGHRRMLRSETEPPPALAESA
ncbi:MAG TPA: hypothetical protein VFK38_02805 [Candidatus Limnocylindrales bacterium]|nr:hypothetical protein [Candidatus Limnocylindrales bacterium]